jgi:hypothetical protein
MVDLIQSLALAGCVVYMWRQNVINKAMRERVGRIVARLQMSGMDVDWIEQG